MKEALHKEKAENREGGAADIPAYPVKRIVRISQRKQRLSGRSPVVEQRQSRVVDKHNHHGENLQDAAA